jgi:hypothetical protein
MREFLNIPASCCFSVNVRVRLLRREGTGIAISWDVGGCVTALEIRRGAIESVAVEIRVFVNL